MKSTITNYLEKLWYRYINKKSFLAFDVETTGLDTKKDRIFSYIFTHPNGKTGVYRVDTRNKTQNQNYWNKLKYVFSSGKYAIIAHNFKFELAMLNRHKIIIHPDLIWYDTMIMSRILRNLWPSHSLDYAPWVLCKYPKELDKIVNQQAKARGDRYDRVDKPLMYDYQVSDGERTMLLFLTWINEFTSNKKLFIDYIVEIELIKATLEMEQVGIKIDWNKSNDLIIDIQYKLDKLVTEVHDYLHEYINLNSDKQLRRLFYKKFNFPITNKTKAGLPATDQETIKNLKNKGYNDPILDMVQKWRTWSNALAIIQGYQERANEKGIIYPTINSCQAKTRRQSTTNPSLQNVGKKEKLDNPYVIPARQCFRARENSLLLFVDYSGIELKLIIDRAHSIKMIDLIKKGKHPHIIACKIFYPKIDIKNELYQDKKYKNCPYANGFRDKKRDKILYDIGKSGHFALGYGSTPVNLGKTLKFLNPEKEGPAAFNRYANIFPEIAYLKKSIAKIAINQGYIKLPFGSRLYIQVSKAYSALNYLIQGTAALILKRAQIMLNKYFKQNWNNHVKMILPIHDEIVLHFPRYMIKYKNQIIHESSALMCDIPEIKTPLEVEWKQSSTTWDDAKNLKIDQSIVNKLITEGCTFVKT